MFFARTLEIYFVRSMNLTQIFMEKKLQVSVGQSHFIKNHKARDHIIAGHQKMCEKKPKSFYFAFPFRTEAT